MVITFVPLIPDASLAEAFTVTVPFPVAVNKPEVLMVAEPVPLVTDQVTVDIVALAGNTVELICNVPPTVEIVVALPAPVTVMAFTKTVEPVDVPLTATFCVTAPVAVT